MDVGGRLPNATTELVYRAVQEALRNVDRHAAARTASVALRGESGTVTLVVEDDGRGMTGDNLREQHAAGQWGSRCWPTASRPGAARCRSSPSRGTGTRVRVSFPRRLTRRGFFARSYLRVDRPLQAVRLGVGHAPHRQRH